MERWWPAQYFVSSGVDGERNWRMEGKSSGKNVPRNPLHSLLENLLNTWPVLTVFIGLILGTEKSKDRRTPTGLAPPATGAQQIVPLGHTKEQPPQSPSIEPTAHPSVWGGSRKQETRDCKGIKILFRHVLPAIGARTSYLNWRSQPRELSAEFVSSLSWSPSTEVNTSILLLCPDTSIQVGAGLTSSIFFWNKKLSQ